MSEFKTKLTFEPRRLSSKLLKKFLGDILRAVKIEDIAAGSTSVPEPYQCDADHSSNYRVLKEMGEISVRDWKHVVEQSDDVDTLYTVEDDNIVQDSRYYYETWRVIHNEVGGHEKLMNFFKFVSTIVGELSSRAMVELSIDGNTVIHDSDTFGRERLNNKSSTSDELLMFSLGRDDHLPTEDPEIWKQTRSFD